MAAASGCPFAGTIKSTAPASGCPFAGIIKATAPAVAPKVPEIVNDFYPRMFAQNPETKAFFNPANQFEEPPRQRMALANAVVAYASNIEDLTPLAGAVEVIAHKHAALTVQAAHYPIVHKNLMESIGHVLGDVVTPEIGSGWSDAVLQLAGILSKREEELYQMAEQRQGGWRGVKDFALTGKREVATDCVEFTFEAVDGKGPIDFTAGQFLTVHLRQEGATPRHYTVTSKPGEPFLQCCVKRLPGGVVSGALHDLAVGSVVGLSPPFGVFALKDSPAVLVSAGIGATPMRSFLAARPDGIRFALHVDRNEASHPFREDFAAVADKHFHYTQASGRPTAEGLVQAVLLPYLRDCDFYLCGPSAFLNDMEAALQAAGAKGVHKDVFGPTLA